MHVLEAARLGADVATMPLNVIEQLLKHPLTDTGLETVYCRLGEVTGEFEVRFVGC